MFGETTLVALVLPQGVKASFRGVPLFREGQGPSRWPTEGSGEHHHGGTASEDDNVMLVYVSIAIIKPPITTYSHL